MLISKKRGINPIYRRIKKAFLLGIAKILLSIYKYGQQTLSNSLLAIFI